ncbi:MAG: HNH endonuclease [Pseudobdellovibrionaceae bacterium]
MLSKISSSDLVRTLRNLVQSERKITSQVLDLLEEVENRKAYLELGYPSLLMFCLQELKYSESSAYRRIQAMRARRETPQIGPALLDGTLSLAVVAKAQGFLSSEEKNSRVKPTPEDRKELFSQLHNKTIQECEKILIEKTPQSVNTKERVRAINGDMTEIKIFIGNEHLEKLNLIRSIISHKISNASYTEAIQWMADETLTRLDPFSAKQGRRQTNKKMATPGQRTYLPKNLKQMVWKKSRGQCCYKNPNSGKRCESKFWLEIDHIVPLAQGGTHEIENLQLLCRAHNQWKGARHSPSSSFIS